ncbi:rhomboid family intramembrane serine protease [Schlesneria sp.]|uniref:rhomboid family intramembrane serine protease n=1 Tax=Schlesneria sp. TaxID=2762018 RepID=UPI002F135B3A
MNWIRLGPVTAESLVLCITLFLSCQFEAISEQQILRDVQRNWGAIQMLHQSVLQDGVRSAGDTELSGPLDVWNGDWWRIPVTPLHHEDTVHLVLCFFGMWYAGHRLEQRWGSFRVLLFLFPAFCIPVMAQLCLGQAITGLSGVICAILGALVVLRRFHGDVAEIFPADAGVAGVCLIGLGWLASIAGIWDCPNAAHLAGFCYGACIAWLVSGPVGHLTIVRAAVVLAHFWMLPALMLAAHPFWVGRYQWYRATQTANLDLADQRLEQAVLFDPTLSGAWLTWSKNAEQQGDLPKAWTRLIEGLSIHPADPRLIDGTRRLWRHLDTQQRRAAEGVLLRFFGSQAAVWLSQIRAGASSKLVGGGDDSPLTTAPADVSQFSLEQKLELPSQPFMRADAGEETPLVPSQFNDAVEGTLF